MGGEFPPAPRAMVAGIWVVVAVVAADGECGPGAAAGLSADKLVLA